VPVGFFFFFSSSGAGPGENDATFRELSQIPNRADKRSKQNQLRFHAPATNAAFPKPEPMRETKEKQSDPDLFGAGESRHATAESSYSGQLRGSGQSDSQA
jgi:hypothetical protein